MPMPQSRRAAWIGLLVALTALGPASLAQTAGSLRGPELGVPLQTLGPYQPGAPAPIPSFINLGANVVEFQDRQAIARLATRWAHPDGVPVVIAHFGDSHVQKGYLPEAIRLALQQHNGSAGRGMVFPYAIAKTYSQNDFTSTFTGAWRTANSIQQPPKLPVGISGFVATTTDPTASVALRASSGRSIPARSASRSSTAPWAPLSIDADDEHVSPTRIVQATSESDMAIAEFDLDQASDTIALQVDQTEPGMGAFELHGVSIENTTGAGVLYHNLGVGGAVFDAVNEQVWFAAGLRDIHPDLVILDFGTNDIVFNNAVAPDFEETVRRAIARVRAVAPRAAILLTSTQDMTFRHRDITASADVSALMRRIAADTGCLYWDWYRVSGGAESAPLWRGATLVGSDGIHLTSHGYQLKGQLLAAALLQTIQYATAHPTATALLAPNSRVADPIGQLLRGPEIDPQ